MNCIWSTITLISIQSTNREQQSDQMAKHEKHIAYYTNANSNWPEYLFCPVVSSLFAIQINKN